MPIQWFPGHMASTRKAIAQRLPEIDVVVELLDARLPGSSTNPLLAELTRGKPALKVLNKQDLAEPELTAAWLAHFNALPGTRALALDAAARVAELPYVVMDALPELSLFPFHLSWPGATLAQEDAATRELMAATSQRGRVMISGAVAGGRYVGRVCVLSFRTHAAQIDHLVEDMAAAIAEVVAKHRALPE